MKELKFKTNLNCSNCVAKVKPFLDKVDGVNNWSVNTDNPNKILTVYVSDVQPEKIIDAVESVGFDIEQL